MRYVFKLETLLNYKDRLKEIAEQELAKKKVQLNAARDKLKELENTREATIGEVKSKREKGIMVSQYILYLNYLQTLSGQITAQEGVIEKLNEAVVECRSKLLKIATEHKVLERIREKDFASFKNSLMKLEEKENDEIVLLRHSHKEMTG